MKRMSIALALLLIFSLIPAMSEGCTTILAGKKATADGSVLHGHNEDMGFTAVGRLWPVPAASHEQGKKIQVPYVELDLPASTLRYWASGNAYGSSGLGIASETRPYDSVLVGMNELGVTMSCNWMYSKEDNLPGKGVRRYAMRQLILERAKTARDAVKLVGDLIDTYGQADWGGLTYCLADPEEAWIVETTSKNWVARRVKDDEVLVVANRFTIGEEFDSASAALISTAVEKGWHDPSAGKFNFRKAYGDPARMSSPYDIDRENRAYDLLGDKIGALLPEDLMAVLTDSYEGTSKYHKPINHIEPWEDVTDKLLIPRAIRTSLCQSSTVAHLRGYLLVEVGSVMWYAMNVPGYSGYFPVYAGASSIPEEFQNVNSAYGQNSAWWTTRILQKVADLDHDLLFSILKGFWEANRTGIRISAAGMENRALELLNKGAEEKKEGMKLIDRFTFSQAKNVLHNTHVFLRKFQDKTGNAPVF